MSTYNSCWQICSFPSWLLLEDHFLMLQSSRNLAKLAFQLELKKKCKWNFSHSFFLLTGLSSQEHECPSVHLPGPSFHFSRSQSLAPFTSGFSFRYYHCPNYLLNIRKSASSSFLYVLEKLPRLQGRKNFFVMYERTLIAYNLTYFFSILW